MKTQNTTNVQRRRFIGLIGDVLFGKKGVKKIKTNIECGLSTCKNKATEVHSNGLIGFYFVCDEHNEIKLEALA